MTYKTDFENDPVTFMRNYFVRTYGGTTSKISHVKFSEDPAMKVRKGQFHFYNKRIQFLKLQSCPQNDPEAIEIYWLGYAENGVASSILGAGQNDPRYMFTVTMNSCTLGHAQANNNAAAYVTHHNAKGSGNATNVIEAQVPQFSDGTTHTLTYDHRGEYMTNSKGALDLSYRGTTFGVRQGNGEWKFYVQNAKRHGMNNTDNNLSLKGVIALNP